MGGNKEYGDVTEPLPVSPWPGHRGVAKDYARTQCPRRALTRVASVYKRRTISDNVEKRRTHSHINAA